MTDENSVVLRVAGSDDVEFLAELVFETNQARQSTKQGWDPEAFRRGLVEDAIDQVEVGVADSTTYVVERAGHPVGRLRLIRTEQAFEVAGLQITPAAQSAGLGTAIIRRVQTEAAAAGRPVVLEVDHDNSGAERLYGRLGFRPGGDARWPDRSQLIWTGVS